MELPKILIVGLHNDNNDTFPPKVIHAEVVVLQTGTNTTVHPILFQLKDESQDFEGLSSESSHFFTPHDDTFVMMGDVVKTDKKNKQIYLSNDTLVNYKYLILVGGEGQPGFSGGIQTLFEALRIRKKLKVPFIDLNNLSRQSKKKNPATHAHLEDKSIAGVENIIQKIVKENQKETSALSLQRTLFEVQL